MLIIKGEIMSQCTYVYKYPKCGQNTVCQKPISELHTQLFCFQHACHDKKTNWPLCARGRNSPAHQLIRDNSGWTYKWPYVAWYEFHTGLCHFCLTADRLQGKTTMPAKVNVLDMHDDITSETYDHTLSSCEPFSSDPEEKKDEIASPIQIVHIAQIGDGLEQVYVKCHTDADDELSTYTRRAPQPSPLITARQYFKLRRTAFKLNLQLDGLTHEQIDDAYKRLGGTAKIEKLCGILREYLSYQN